MKYRLVHNKHYNTTIWYMVLETLEQIDQHNGSYARWYWNTTWSDPHFEAALKSNDNTIAVIRHPMNLLPKRQTAQMKQFFNFGAIYINKNGGWCVPCESDTILDEIENDRWPEVATERQETESWVYISKWPLGNHYYLHSWPNVIQFAAEKYDTYEEAFAEAKRHTSEARIKMKDHPHERFVYPRSGD